MNRESPMNDYLRHVRRDEWGFGVPCEQPGCYEIGLEPDGKCERHGSYGRSKKAAARLAVLEGREPA